MSMHDSSFKFMESFVKKYINSGNKVLDVGSYDFNGCYKPLFPNCDYIGLDLEYGPNVDVVSKDPYNYPFPDETFDAVICGQCLEHSFHPWRVINEIGRLTKKNGFACIIVPWQFPIHRFPVDCFRILPDGLTQLMKDAGFKVITCYATETIYKGTTPVCDWIGIRPENDCYGIGSKI